MTYDVRVVEDTALPEDQDWVLMRHGERVTFAVKRSAQSPQTMAEGWAAYRLLSRHPAIPRQLHAVC
jgi:hypothetical protein